MAVINNSDSGVSGVFAALIVILAAVALGLFLFGTGVFDRGSGGDVDVSVEVPKLDTPKMDAPAAPAAPAN